MKTDRYKGTTGRLAGALLILTGLLVMLYPHAVQWHNDRQMRLLLQEIDQAMAQTGTNPEERTIESYDNLTAQFEAVGRTESEVVTPEPTPTPNPQPPARPPLQPTGPLLGTISIARINVRMPIFYGATEANMALGTGLIEGTSALGTVGNAAIAGHRSQRFGRQFNRLNELAIDDLIVIDTPNGQLTYRVFRTHIVKPTDMWVLNRSREHAVLTLVTCEPIYPATHRLIVHSVLVTP